MAKGLIQTAHWRSTTLIVSEIGADSRRRRRERALHGRRAVVADWWLPIRCRRRWSSPRSASSVSTTAISTTTRRPAAARPSSSSARCRRSESTLLFLAALYTMFPALIVARGVLAPAATMAVTALIGWRLAFEWLARQVGPRERLLLVGTSSAAFGARARAVRARRSSASRSSASSIPTQPRRCIGAQLGVPRHDRRHPGDRARARRRPRRRQPCRRARQAADGQAARDEARRRAASTTWPRSTRSTPARSPSRTCVRAG